MSAGGFGRRWPQYRAERLRLEAPELDYEGLVEVLARLIEPLKAFADAERRPAAE